METWMDLFWLSIVHTFVFGMIALYLAGEAPEQAGVVLVGLAFWQIIEVAQYSVSLGMMWEVWSKSFSGLFITPLTTFEFILGHSIGAIFKATGVYIFTGLLMLLVFGFSVFYPGMMLIVYFFEFLMFGIAFGMFINALIVRFGTNIQSLAWGLIFFFQPLGAVFFPVDVLPVQVRWIAFSFPITYLYESLRSQLFDGVTRWDYIGKATLLNFVYLIVMYGVLTFTTKWAKKSGAFVRMEQ